MLQAQAMAPGRLAILGHLGTADLLDQLQAALDLTGSLSDDRYRPVAYGGPGGAWFQGTGRASVL
jgi:hypothetical protein